jgi:hypothetical protein
MIRIATLAVLHSFAAACTQGANSGGMGGMGGGASVPPVIGYTEGQLIQFIHTEASEPAVADLLTQMMGSPVLHVPELGQAPEPMLATVYVFTNGVKGDGPLGFQSDVFDHPPGTPGYRPLRSLVRVTWSAAAAAREITSAADLLAAAEQGEVTFERPGIVVNMPMLTWPGGQR